MANYPENLFALAGADIGSQHLEIFTRTSSNSNASASVTTAISIPENTVLLLNNIQAFTVAGGAQITTGISIFLRRAGVNILTLRTKFNLTTGADETDMQFAGIPIRGATEIAAFGSFSAGAVANAITLNVLGIGIPRGNFVQT